jgi:hypothetical protein
MLLQNEKMLVCLKSTDGHGMCNVLKHRKNFINHINNLATPSTSNSIIGSTLPFKPFIYFHFGFNK